MGRKGMVVSYKAVFFDWIDKVIRFSLYGLMLAIPFGNAPVEIFGNCAAGFYLLQCVVRTVLRQPQGFFLERSKNSRQENIIIATVFAFVTWNVVSATASISYELSWIALYAKLMECILVFFAVRQHICKRRHVRIMVNCLFVAALVAGVNGLLQWFLGFDLIKQSAVIIDEERRISSSFYHANGFASYLIFVIPITLVFSFMFKHVRRDICVRDKVQPAGWQKWFQPDVIKSYVTAIMVVLVICLGLTFSRGAWIGLLAGMIFLLLCHKRFFLPLLIGGAVIIMVFAPMMKGPRSMDFFQAKAYHANTESESSIIEIFKSHASGRATFWRDGWRIARARPVIGWGLNTYSYVLNQFPDAHTGYYVHNSYLQMAAEIGFVGVGLFITILIGFYINVMNGLQRMPKGYIRSLYLGISAGLLAFLVHAFFDVGFYTVQLALIPWIAMGLCLALNRISLR